MVINGYAVYILYAMTSCFVCHAQQGCVKHPNLRLTLNIPAFLVDSFTYQHEGIRRNVRQYILLEQRVCMAATWDGRDNATFLPESHSTGGVKNLYKRPLITLLKVVFLNVRVFSSHLKYSQNY